MPTPYRELVETLFSQLREGQELQEWVLAERGRDRSWRQIAEDLGRLTERRINVTHATLYDWFKADDKAAA